ncbi:type I-E CRISPR-associated protein Cse2/CasB [Arsenicicoccus cauae]|uniref:type I-E CRISPR-associated protein Cse2/CasB n=1 Tax=Arsenicicoccus cauae TaxID=2663847 RepID=UPI00370D980A
MTTQHSVDTPTSPPRSPSERLGRAVGDHIAQLQAAFLGRRSQADEARARGLLAQLRRARPEDVTADPAALPATIGFLAEDLLGRDPVPSRSERAAHASIVLYAIHQQSQSTAMHVRGASLGRAAGRLARRTDPAALDEGVVRRFTAIVGAGSFDEAIYHLRSFVGLLQSADPAIGLDYAALAQDLVRLQDSHGADRVRLSWTRDLHRPPHRPGGATPLLADTTTGA